MPYRAERVSGRCRSAGHPAPPSKQPPGQGALYVSEDNVTSCAMQAFIAGYVVIRKFVSRQLSVNSFPPLHPPWGIRLSRNSFPPNCPPVPSFGWRNEPPLEKVCPKGQKRLETSYWIMTHKQKEVKNGHKTEIDCVLITRKGIFCIET